MKNTSPASPEELRIDVRIYMRSVVGQNERGQDKFRYVLRKQIKVKESRQKSSSNNAVHSDRELFFSRFIGNWWEFSDVIPTDIIVVSNTQAQFGLAGPVVNWEQRNRWGIIDAVADLDCHRPEGIDSCNCV